MGLKLYFFDFEPRIGLTKPGISDRFSHVRPRMRETGNGEHRPGVSVRTALVYEGELAPVVRGNGYFDAIVPASRLLGLD